MPLAVVDSEGVLEVAELAVGARPEHYAQLPGLGERGDPALPLAWRVLGTAVPGEASCAGSRL